jgi:ribonuclease-3
MSDNALEILQKKIGYSFNNIERLAKSLTHSSVGTDRNYERLEFLGDRVLGLVMARILFEEFPNENEGDLAKRHAALVQGKTVAQVAKQIDLGAAMILSDSERAAGGADNENILADGMEGLLGALYMDGGLDVCDKIIKELWGDRVLTVKRPPQDPKTALQEWAQARALPLPTYSLSAREGPDHAPTFEIEVFVEGYPAWRAKGTSRRKAEKLAAGMLLAHLEEMES